ncbi:MAG: PilN domain-containing protein [Pseudomonadota bacterium]
MRKINLLPWREELRQEKQRSFLLLLALTALIAGGLVYAGKEYFQGQIDGQIDRNNYLRAEISKLDEEIARIEQLDETRTQLINRKNVIEDLQANRSLMVHLFDQLVRTVPTGIRLLNVRQVGDQLTVTGTSQSSGRVSTYMRNLEESEFLHNPSLQIIEAETDETDREMPYSFGLTFTLASPSQIERSQSMEMEVATP